MAKVEPFSIQVPDEVLADLKGRLDRTRFPDEVPDTAWEYGTNLAYLRELVDYWRTQYDWRKHEKHLNSLRHFRTEIADLDLHFIHEEGRGPNPKPLLLIHGWPARSMSSWKSFRCSLTLPRTAVTRVTPSP